MGKDVYITDEERVKCKRVAEAFAELYEVFCGRVRAASAQKGKEGLKNEDWKTSGHTGVIKDEGQVGQYPG